MKVPNRSSVALTVLSAGMLFLVACGVADAQPPQEWVDTRTKDFVGEQMKRYWENQPPPAYDYSAQRDVLIQLYNATIPELRPAWHVFSTPGVGYTDMCAGMGAPLPYGVSLTSPDYKWGETSMPLSEPPGYYTNDLSTEATWVLCDYGHGLEPRYSEALVETFFHPVELKDGELIHLDEEPSIKIDVKKAS